MNETTIIVIAVIIAILECFVLYLYQKLKKLSRELNDKSIEHERKLNDCNEKIARLEKKNIELKSKTIMLAQHISSLEFEADMDSIEIWRELLDVDKNSSASKD